MADGAHPASQDRAGRPTDGAAARLRDTATIPCADALLAEAEKLEREARLEFVWAERNTEWPHHRAEYRRAGLEAWKEAERLRNLAGAPLFPYPGAHYLPAQAIEARRAIDSEAGVVGDESAVGNADAPKQGQGGQDDTA